MRGEPSLCLGIDVGGTNIKLGVVDPAGEVRQTAQYATEPTDDPEATCQQIIELARAHLIAAGQSLGEVTAVGVAIPGILDLAAGCLREVSNLPHLTDFPLRACLEQLAQRPITLINDANAAAYAEHVRRGLGESSSALVTLGTGIGCGVVLRGVPFSGDDGCAGELGHLRIDMCHDARRCGCGKQGHLEAYAGAPGVIATAREALADGQPSCLASAGELTPETIAAGAEAGDALCQRLVFETADLVGLGISHFCQSVNPRTVLLGGAMTFGGRSTRTGNAFLGRVKKSVEESSLTQVGTNLQLDLAVLGNTAGVLGAAEIARRQAALPSD